MLRLHFLNVGHGDCTFIESPSGRLTLVDINNSKSLSKKEVSRLAASLGVTVEEFSRPGSRSGIFGMLGQSWEDYYKSLLVDPYEYYKEHFDGRPIWRYIQTHPDMDHMSGLHRFFWQEKVPLYNFWDVDHAKTQDDVDFNGTRYSFDDWETYTKLRAGTGSNGSHNVFHNLRHEKNSYWNEDSMYVLSPTQPLIDLSDEAEEWNNVSYVLRFSHASRSVILAGDAVKEAWDSIVDEIEDELLDCDFLKAAHHGRVSGYHYSAVEKMSPHAVVCSIGKKPSSDAHQNYKSHGADVFSTRHKGTMILTIEDDGSASLVDKDGNILNELPAWA